MVQRRKVHPKQRLLVATAVLIVASLLAPSRGAEARTCGDWSQRLVLLTVSSTDENSDTQLAEERDRWLPDCEITGWSDKLHDKCEVPFLQEGGLVWARTAQ